MSQLWGKSKGNLAELITQELIRAFHHEKHESVIEFKRLPYDSVYFVKIQIVNLYLKHKANQTLSMIISVEIHLTLIST